MARAVANKLIGNEKKTIKISHASNLEYITRKEEIKTKQMVRE